MNRDEGILFWKFSLDGLVDYKGRRTKNYILHSIRES